MKATVTIHLSPNACIDAKTAYYQVCAHMRSEFEQRLIKDDTEENVMAFAHWDMQYKMTETVLHDHYEKFDTGALLNLIDNGTTFNV